MPAPKRKASGARKSPRNAKEATPIHNLQSKLAAEQAKLTQEKVRIERFIADAPRRAEEEKRRQQEELIARAAQGGHRMGTSGALVDKRYGPQPFQPARRKGLRSHRRAARLQFFALCIVLVALVIIVLRHMP